jgi:hypothetical protein
MKSAKNFSWPGSVYDVRKDFIGSLRHVSIHTIINSIYYLYLAEALDPLTGEYFTLGTLEDPPEVIVHYVSFATFLPSIH